MSAPIPYAEAVAEFEPVIGMEVHVELGTESKIFCGCPTAFGAPPNTQVCPVCLGLPGSMPVMNEMAIESTIRIGLALNCSIAEWCRMARKNYFYPDMAKDFQTTQYDQPTSRDGELVLADGTVVGIERAHIEEDAGKTTHVGGGGRINDAQYSLVDYNRAGVPLVEIVSRPDIRTVDHAKAYVSELRDILLAIEVSDAKMEEGSMRVDANVSVRPAGSDELRTRCELKNINSIRSLGRAIEYEARRHVDLYESGEAPRQETRHWDEDGGRSTAGRSKEDADDYRYFQEPDLVPLTPSADHIAEIDDAMPMLPAARRARLGALSSVADDVLVTVVERGQDQLALGAIEAGADPDRVLTRIQNDLAVEDWSAVNAETLATVLQMESSGELSATQAKQVLADMAAGLHGGDPKAIAASHGFEAMASGALDALVDELIADHPDEWARFTAGDDSDRKKMQGFFTGQIMKASKGQADGRAVAELLSRKST